MSLLKKHLRKSWIGVCPHIPLSFLELPFFSKDNLFLHKEVKKENKREYKNTRRKQNILTIRQKLSFVRISNVL